ncbi:MAG TPA: carboxypeptidase M32, partial [Rectinemataceae bacterium]|nr:carboxypeptidase M32 [Rectinemataceae bacterium]
MLDDMKHLIELDKEHTLLSHIGAVLGWDQETYLPERGIEERAEQIAFMEGLSHEKAVNPEIGKMLDNMEADEKIEAIEKAYVRVMRREYDKETKLPSGLVTEMARQTSLSQAAWVQARKDNDFARFAPHLQKMIDLNLEMARNLNPTAKPYDVLLDLYEFGSTEESIAAVFSMLKSDLENVLKKIRSRPQVDDSFLHKKVSQAAQEKMSGYIMDVIGFDRTRGRLDKTAHPFTTTLGRDDVRITTRYVEDFFPSSIFSTVHESGHAFYEMGIDPHPDFRGTRLADAASMAVHESQSRMWENIIGRSAFFWKKHYKAVAALSEGALDGVSLDAFVRAINKVETSLIRTEADEVTYGLHIIARFELEAALMRGSLAVADLPAAWNAKIKELFDLDVPDNARGCLQDVHWSMGAFGYFPSYALGNLYAAQFWTTMKGEIPDLEKRIEEGDSAAVLAWLR